MHFRNLFLKCKNADETHPKKIQQRLAQYPAVALAGSPQSGKTTLARRLPGAYFDLEQEADRLKLDLQTERLLFMLAVSHRREWNASQIGKSIGLSYHTVNHYLDYLEGAFLIRRLQPFHANIRKRLIKRPKVYWRDSGLLHAIMNVTDFDGLLNQP